MLASPIPAPDPAPIPGPPALFHLLWVVTFLLHMLFVNLVLGGSVLGTAALAIGPAAARRRIASWFTEVNAWAVSLAITFGIAPLLFMQVLYGRFFYTATVLVAWGWLGMLGLLMAGYYLNYVAKYRFRAGQNAAAPLGLAAVLFLAVAATQVAVHLLHAQPDRWLEVAASPWSVFADPSFVPRFLHFVLAAVSMSGSLLAWKAVRRPPLDAEREEAAAMARFGVTATLLATLLQMADGFWLLVSLPGPVLKALMRGGMATMGSLTLGIFAGLGLLVVLARIRDPIAERGLVRHAMELVLLATVFMVITRHQLRDLYLASARAGEKLAVAPQWGVLALFVVAFAGCVGLTVWAIVGAVKDRPAAGEPVA